jgi:hypothetical protein
MHTASSMKEIPVASSAQPPSAWQHRMQTHETLSED